MSPRLHPRHTLSAKLNRGHACLPETHDEDKFDHPTQKPIELMRRPILNHLRRDELVYDLFLGSGTTLVAAELTGRVCRAIELDPKYVDVAVKRWRKLSGQVARLDGDGRTFDQIAQARCKQVLDAAA
jgi:DNA modification methylase